MTLSFSLSYKIELTRYKDIDYSGTHNDSTWKWISLKFTFLVPKLPRTTINKVKKQCEDFFSLLFHFWKNKTQKRVIIMSRTYSVKTGSYIVSGKCLRQRASDWGAFWGWPPERKRCQADGWWIRGLPRHYRNSCSFPFSFHWLISTYNMPEGVRENGERGWYWCHRTSS